MLDLQDHFEALVYIFGGGKPVPNWLRPLNPHKMHSRKSSDGEGRETKSLDAIRPARDAAFRARITRASEWTDSELLFRALVELKAEPLILSMPIDTYAERGVSRSSCGVYYGRSR